MTTYMCKLLWGWFLHVGSEAEAAASCEAFFYKYVSRNAYFRHQSIFNDKFRHQCNRAWKNYKPYFRGGIGKIFHYMEKLFLGGGRHKNKLHFKGIIKLSKVPSYQSSPISKYTRIFCCRGKDGHSNQLFEYKTWEFDIFL